MISFSSRDGIDEGKREMKRNWEVYHPTPCYIHLVMKYYIVYQHTYMININKPDSEAWLDESITVLLYTLVSRLGNTVSNI